MLRYYNEKSPRISVAASNPREAATEVDTQEGFDATIGVSASKLKVFGIDGLYVSLHQQKKPIYFIEGLDSITPPAPILPEAITAL